MKVIIEYKFDNINNYVNKCRSNYFYANKTKQTETNIAEISFRNIPKIENYPIELIFTWHIKSKTCDLDGKLPKNIIDGLVRAKKIPDDNVKYIQKITHLYQEDKDEKVEIEIKPLKEIKHD